tara:strand:+ start:84 stop:365 length:282 start_codon:yes stop_codon:yes gene_type:complete
MDVTPESVQEMSAKERVDALRYLKTSGVAKLLIKDYDMVVEALELLLASGDEGRVRIEGPRDTEDEESDSFPHTYRAAGGSVFSSQQKKAGAE